MQRWKPDSPGYKLAEQHVQRRKRSLIKQRIEVCAREMWFLLAMKAMQVTTVQSKLFFRPNTIYIHNDHIHAYTQMGML